MENSADTIFALASGVGRAGVAVYRISGPASKIVYASLCKEGLPPARQAKKVSLFHGPEKIDEGLALWFPGPSSFTGEDVLEFHLHGGMAVAESLSDALSEMGIRVAEPGEFSKRAFLAGKMDLTQAEAIADLVDAETAEQKRQALRQMDGALSRLYDHWREVLLSSQAYIEANIDFSDEDIPDALDKVAMENLLDIANQMREHLDDGGQGERIREGYWLSLLGPVNVGKSSLLNLMSGRSAAIVSGYAGTTRDIIEVRLNINGVPVTLADTAGLRETAEAVEEEGIRRARERASLSDLRLVVFDAGFLPGIDPEVEILLKEGRALAVANKIDQAQAEIPEKLHGCMVFPVSAKTGEGVEALLKFLGRELAVRQTGALPLLTRTRHRMAVSEALAALDRALIADLPELAAEDVRVAASAIGRITGRIDVEDVLDAIFSEFCIGK